MRNKEPSVNSSDPINNELLKESQYDFKKSDEVMEDVCDLINDMIVQDIVVDDDKDNGHKKVNVESFKVSTKDLIKNKISFDYA